MKKETEVSYHIDVLKQFFWSFTCLRAINGV